MGIEGGAAVTSDILALIDFYVDNGIIEKGEDGEEVYPVTAKQIGHSDEVGPPFCFSKFLYPLFLGA